MMKKAQKSYINLTVKTGAKIGGYMKYASADFILTQGLAASGGAQRRAGSSGSNSKRLLRIWAEVSLQF
jgi:hypothetical protein